MDWENVLSQLEDAADMVHREVEVEDYAEVLACLVQRLIDVSGRADWLEELRTELTLKGSGTNGRF
jgi:hypothetical protein